MAPGPLRRALRTMRWTRTSTVLMSGFILTLGLILVVWWPLAVDAFSAYNPAYPWWVQMDWLLIGDFLAMSVLIMAGADLKTDVPIVLVGLAGGLAIEGWGTQTSLWTYYTAERPPLWIIPAWPIASLAIERLTRLLGILTATVNDRIVRTLYWLTFAGFVALMVPFVWPTATQSLTILAGAACLLMILSPTDPRTALLSFIAGSGLGYFLELWGTTRGCWTYYTQQTPPVFAVFAHGMAAVAFWRAKGLVFMVLGRVLPKSDAGASKSPAPIAERRAPVSTVLELER